MSFVYLQWALYKPDEEEHPHYIFPDDDLAPSLIDAYFVQINPFMPLLHRPTFQRLVNERLHHVDPMFGSVYMLVCAHGARYSEDPRVLSEGTNSPRSAGWRWFEQIDIYRRPFTRKASLYELQRIAVLDLTFIFDLGCCLMPLLTLASRYVCECNWESTRMLDCDWIGDTVSTRCWRSSKTIARSCFSQCWGGIMEEGFLVNFPFLSAFFLFAQNFFLRVIFSIERIICSFSGRSCALQGEE